MDSNTSAHLVFLLLYHTTPMEMFVQQVDSKKRNSAFHHTEGQVSLQAWRPRYGLPPQQKAGVPTVKDSISLSSWFLSYNTTYYV